MPSCGLGAISYTLVELPPSCGAVGPQWVMGVAAPAPSPSASGSPRGVSEGGLSAGGDGGGDMDGKVDRSKVISGSGPTQVDDPVDDSARDPDAVGFGSGSHLGPM